MISFIRNGRECKADVAEDPHDTCRVAAKLILEQVG
jgi:hypothetical protein